MKKKTKRELKLERMLSFAVNIGIVSLSKAGGFEIDNKIIDAFVAGLENEQLLESLRKNLYKGEDPKELEYITKLIGELK